MLSQKAIRRLKNLKNQLMTKTKMEIRFNDCRKNRESQLREKIASVYSQSFTNLIEIFEYYEISQEYKKEVPIWRHLLSHSISSKNYEMGLDVVLTLIFNNQILKFKPLDFEVLIGSLLDNPISTKVIYPLFDHVLCLSGINSGSIESQCIKMEEKKVLLNFKVPSMRSLSPRQRILLTFIKWVILLNEPIVLSDSSCLWIGTHDVTKLVDFYFDHNNAANAHLKWFIMGTIYYRCSLFEQSLTCYERACQLAPQFTPYQLILHHTANSIDALVNNHPTLEYLRPLQLQFQSPSQLSFRVSKYAL